jgi:ABC-type glucose/galactose transport system permease subunit
VAWTVVLVMALSALLALLAYVMIARLRLHPLGLLAGASSFVAAASIEALRLLMKKKS